MRRAKAICFFQYPTANIYLTTSWRVCGGGTEACAKRAFQDPARLFLTAVDGCCNFDDGRDGETKSNSHFSYAPGAQIRKTFSQNWLSHYGTISKSSSGRVQAGVIWVEGRGLRRGIMAEIHLLETAVEERRCEKGAIFLFISFPAFKTDGSLYAERKCLLTGLAHCWWLPSNDNNGIGGECEQQCSLLSSDDVQTDGLQPADTVALAPSLAVTHLTNVKHRTNCTRDML